MTPYYETLLPKAKEVLSPLAAKVATLEKQLAAAVDRQRHEGENLARTEEALTRHKAAAAERLTAGTSAYREWQGHLRRLTLEGDSGRSALTILEREIIPGLRRDLTAARTALEQAAGRFYKEQLPPVEVRLAALLNDAVAERDDFLNAMIQIGKDLNVSIFGEAPRAICARLEFIDRFALSGNPWVTFLPQPPAEQAAALAALAPAPDTPTTIAPVPAEAQSTAVGTPSAVPDDTSVKVEALAPEPLDPAPADVDAEVEAVLDAKALDSQDTAPEAPAVAAEDFSAESS